MKLLASISLFAVAALAVTYPAGTNCHTNTECNNNCLDGSWTIMNVDGDYQLVCDPTKGDPTQYYRAQCYVRNIGSYRGEDLDAALTRSGEASKATCDKSGGWEKACGAQKSGTSIQTFVTASEAAFSGTKCDANTVFPNVKRDIAFEA
ncbi:unnamed protein product [Penicillium pancosmium]